MAVVTLSVRYIGKSWGCNICIAIDVCNYRYRVGIYTP